METQAKKERNANIEMLRIFAMIMVITLHNLAGSGALYEQHGFLYHFYWWMEALSICAVDVFVLISAYFLVNSSFNLRNIARILIITWFYSFPLSFLSAKIIGSPIGTVSFLKMLFPILTKKYWFVNAYLAMYLLSPFLNKLLRILTKEQFTCLLWIEVGMMILRPTLFPKAWAQDLTAGLSVFFFISLYIVAAWIRLYGSHWKASPRNCILLYLFLSLILVSFKALLMYLGIAEDTASRYYCYDSAFVVLQALALFLAALYAKPYKGKLAKMINSVAQYSFAAYIIHYAMNSVIWRRILHLDHFVGYPLFGPLIILLSSVFIFFICILLDSIRARITRFLFFCLEPTRTGEWAKNSVQKWNDVINGKQ